MNGSIRRHKRFWVGLLLLASSLLLTGCVSVDPFSHHPEPITKPEPSPPVKATQGDGPPHQDIDVAHIPNAVPKVEPLSRYGNPSVYEVFGKKYKVMEKSHGYSAKGVASWYGKKFHGRKTSSGEPYDMLGMTAAHRSLPIPTYAKVTNLKNGKEVVVKINDRGPFVGDRLIDLSYAAAKKLGFHADGTTHVHITAIDPVAWHKENKNTALAKTEDKKVYLQLGAFNKKLSADELAKHAVAAIEKNSHSLKTKIRPEVLAHQSLYKVRIGPLKNKAEAEKLQKILLTLDHRSHSTVIYE